jgi:cytochrome d ubiquinol oxidase subunit II
MEHLAALLVIVSLLIYAILFSIECGATIFIAFPKLLGGNDLVYKYIGPVWETTNVFLVTALVSLIAFFPKALPVWGVALIVPFLVFLLVMGIRVIGMLYVFYSEGRNRAMRLLLLAAGLAAPAVLAGGLFPFFISGGMPYSGGEWVLALVFGSLALVSTALISSSFFQYLNRRSKQIKSSNAFVKFSLFLFLAIALISVMLIKRIVPHLIFGIKLYLPELVALAVLNLMFLFIKDAKYSGLKFISALALFAVLFLAILWAQLPYVVYPTVTIFSAFTDPASAGIMLGAFGIALIFLIPSLALLYYLFAIKK